MNPHPHDFIEVRLSNRKKKDYRSSLPKESKITSENISQKHIKLEEDEVICSSASTSNKHKDNPFVQSQETNYHQKNSPSNTQKPQQKNKQPNRKHSRGQKTAKTRGCEKSETVKDYLCHICSKQSRSLAFLNCHIENVHGEGCYQCDVCHKSFVSLNYLQTHKNRVHGKKRFRCDQCSQIFKSSSNVRKHIRVVHEMANKKPFVCHYCNSGFTQKFNRDEHIRVKHQKKYRITCNFCGKRFNKKSKLEKHVNLQECLKPVKTIKPNGKKEAEETSKYIIPTPETLQSFGIQQNIWTVYKVPHDIPQPEPEEA